MTFTSIPPSLRPVVEDVYEKMNSGPYTWESDATEIEQLIIAFLNACVERGVGRVGSGVTDPPRSPYWTATDYWAPLKKEWPALILNLGATDDTA